MTEILHVIAGNMFSGKTEELIRLAGREYHADHFVQVFKPDIDTRWGKNDKIVSHGGAEMEALPVPVEKPSAIFKSLLGKTKVVAIDEAQFFGPEIVEVTNKLLLKNIKVLIAGLNTDFRGEPFGSMPTLLALADYVTKLTAICKFKENGETCGRDATRTQRLINGQPANYSDPIVLIGAEESYTARCVEHHIVPGKPNSGVLFDASKK